MRCDMCSALVSAGGAELRPLDGQGVRWQGCIRCMRVLATEYRRAGVEVLLHEFDVAHIDPEAVMECIEVAELLAARSGWSDVGEGAGKPRRGRGPRR